MTKETREPDGHSPQPSWLELTEPEQVRHTYWTCWGTSNVKGAKDRWMTLNHTKEEAEAYASIPKATWTWDGKEATPRTLTDAMFEARSGGYAGICVMGYRDGKWQTLKEFPASVPLMGEE